MTSRYTITGLGEALFDMLPDGEHLGGAPLNVAIHAHQLLKTRQGRGVVVSRVGQDALANQVFDELTRRDMDTAYIQTDPDYDTGRVYVDLDAQGQPTYDIVTNVAWDVIQFDPDLEDLARRCDAVVFGTLAQRHAQSRNTIHRFLADAQRAIRLFDVNLRQSYYDQSILQRSCEHATAVKLNREELPVVVRALGLTCEATEASQAQALLKQFELKMVVLTRGREGTILFTPAGVVEGQPVSYPPADQADAIGAGDACSAGLLAGMVLRLPLEKQLELANHMGAYVASQPGATPVLPASMLDLLHR